MSCDQVCNGIPAIKRGEAAYWQVSCLPPGYLALVRSSSVKAV
jgi:hypothetical protein